MVLKKIICFFLGHKIPKNGKVPVCQVASQKLNDQYYVWQIFPCERCITYEYPAIYSAQEWEQLNAAYHIEASVSWVDAYLESEEAAKRKAYH